VARWSKAVGHRLGLDDEAQRTLHLAGLLHDVGKIGIADRILRKPGPLKGDEWDVVKQHPQLAVVIIDNASPQSAMLTPAILHHHERFDGSGYPRGIKGNEIPLFARILGIADTFAAMVVDRPYRNAIAQSQAIAYLRSQSGGLFDPALVEVFIDCIKEESPTETKPQPVSGSARTNAKPTRPIDLPAED
jgi:HD-GYP domain-containing protein (c-di-GMP phosphodiesterase class II)